MDREKDNSYDASLDPRDRGVSTGKRGVGDFGVPVVFSRVPFFCVPFTWNDFVSGMDHYHPPSPGITTLTFARRWSDKNSSVASLFGASTSELFFCLLFCLPTLSQIPGANALRSKNNYRTWYLVRLNGKSKHKCTPFCLHPQMHATFSYLQERGWMVGLWVGKWLCQWVGGCARACMGLWVDG